MPAFSSSFLYPSPPASSYSPFGPAPPPPPAARRPNLPQPSRTSAFSQRSQASSQEAEAEEGDDFPEFQSPSPVDLAAVSRQQMLPPVAAAAVPAASCPSAAPPAAASVSQPGLSPAHWSSPLSFASSPPAPQVAIWQACDDEPPLLPVKKRPSSSSLSGSQPAAPPPFVSKYKAIPSKPLLRIRQRSNAAAQQRPQPPPQQSPSCTADAASAAVNPQPQLVSASLYAAAMQSGAAPPPLPALPLPFPALVAQDGGVLEAAQPPALSAFAAPSQYPPAAFPFAHYAQFAPLMQQPLFPAPFSSFPTQPQLFQQQQRCQAQPLPAPFPPSAFDKSLYSHKTSNPALLPAAATVDSPSPSVSASESTDSDEEAADDAAVDSEMRPPLRQAARWGAKILRAVDEYAAVYRRLQRVTAGQWTDAEMDAQMSKVQCEQVSTDTRRTARRCCCSSAHDPVLPPVCPLQLFNAHGWTCVDCNKAELIRSLREWLRRGWLLSPHEVRKAARSNAATRKRKRPPGSSQHSKRTAAAAAAEAAPLRPTTAAKEPRPELTTAAPSQRSGGSGSPRVKKEKDAVSRSAARGGSDGSVSSVSPGGGDERQSDSDYEPQAEPAPAASVRSSASSASSSSPSPPTAPVGPVSPTGAAVVQAAGILAESEEKAECADLASCRSFMLKQDDAVTICVEGPAPLPLCCSALAWPGCCPALHLTSTALLLRCCPLPLRVRVRAVPAQPQQRAPLGQLQALHGLQGAQGQLITAHVGAWLLPVR